MKGQMSEALCRYRHKASYADPVVMPILMKESLVWTGKRDAEIGIIAVHLERLTASAGWAQSQLKTPERVPELRR